MRILFLILCLTGCSDGQQYYSRHFHNESEQELKNVILYWNDGTNAKSVGGTMISGAVAIKSFLYIKPPMKPILRWEDLFGNNYEYQLDLKGIFPTEYNGGDFHVVIRKDFSVDYTFVFLKKIIDDKLVRTEIVYSPENRTAK